ncbi:MAG: phosphatase PAP2 family protein [Alphaproteobacteria bacterium]|nr:phosphatase PAP2 family protein [Alphaproteobacteria bacterium]MBV9063406.1 phosphatase PAP2 family protein [Alphaproteobacteria bacterium]
MLLWAGVLLLLTGFACFALDRRATHLFHDRISSRTFHYIRMTTDFAKGAHWLMACLAAIAASWLARRLWGDLPILLRMGRVSLAFLACLAASSAVLHSIKLVFGRRRPRDEIEHELYGFRFFHYDWQHDSFPSGHAMTIFCVAVILSGVFPSLAWLWCVIALYLALTRAMLNAHFLSDVFIGAGIALIASRETLLLLFPDLSRPWF